MKRALFIVVVGLCLQACATTPAVYGAIGPKVPYGYKDRPNPDGGFTVLVALPPSAKPSNLRAFFDRRAAELCPAGVERTNVFRVSHDVYYASAPAVYGSVGISQRVYTGAELEGYVYCKAAPPPRADAA